MYGHKCLIFHVSWQGQLRSAIIDAVWFIGVSYNVADELTLLVQFETHLSAVQVAGLTILSEKWFVLVQ